MFAPAAFNQNGREYLLTANENVMICVQIESRTAVENVEAIASVQGIGKEEQFHLAYMLNH
jgi:4-hydroxy-2-oxoheptanedioate aldolase